ncbi:MAG TPA: hypothetical protein VJ385_12090 [Fibrobacteria bacterium]|nr:hypothetical protein [Fibrobacteria bacterium]
MQNDIRAKLIQVIEVEHLRSGDEASGLPSRWVKTYWDLKGNFLSEHDPLIEELNRKGHAAHSHATSKDVFRP